MLVIKQAVECAGSMSPCGFAMRLQPAVKYILVLGLAVVAEAVYGTVVACMQPLHPLCLALPSKPGSRLHSLRLAERQRLCQTVLVILSVSRQDTEHY